MRIGWLLGLLPGPALACGGLFCSTGPAAAPVDQNAERILFEMEADQICTTVQIRYVGSPEAFAWVVPVPEPPTVEDGDQATLDALAQAVALQWQMPAIDTQDCPQATGFGEEASCGGCASDDAGGGSAAAWPDGGVFPTVDGVQVFDRQQTDNYETATIGAENAAVLVDWLVLNQFNVSENMVPAMQPYADERQVFLAIKLRTDVRAAQIAPVRFCYRAAAPSIPLRLTAVAAQPQMAVQVFVAGYTLFAPMDAEHSPPDPDVIAFDGNLRTNYSAWVAREVAHNNGRFWSEEYADRTPLAGLPPWLTVWYSRMGPEQMDHDPTFVAAPDLPGAQGLVDLSGRAAVLSCNGPIAARQPSACAFVFCGVGATCVDFGNGQAGCDCPGDQVAVTVDNPDGTRNAVCAPAANPLGVTPEDGGDPCAFADCGQGECIARGGFATCRCAEGAAAVAAAPLVCTAYPAMALTFAEGASIEAGNDDDAPFDGPARARSVGFWAFLAVLGWGIGRRFTGPATRRRRR